MGLEFLFRLLADPRTKWQRVFIEIPEFLARVLGQYLTQRVAGPRAGR
jgi:UDP-N-acetyl-D-mannosaminuronic acid transferase (WecB/TagA/CpsF family)